MPEGSCCRYARDADRDSAASCCASPRLPPAFCRSRRRGGVRRSPPRQLSVVLAIVFALVVFAIIFALVGPVFIHFPNPPVALAAGAARRHRSAVRCRRGAAQSSLLLSSLLLAALPPAQEHCCAAAGPGDQEVGALACQQCERP